MKYAKAIILINVRLTNRGLLNYAKYQPYQGCSYDR